GCSLARSSSVSTSVALGRPSAIADLLALGEVRQGYPGVPGSARLNRRISNSGTSITLQNGGRPCRHVLARAANRIARRAPAGSDGQEEQNERGQKAGLHDLPHYEDVIPLRPVERALERVALCRVPA